MKRQEEQPAKIKLSDFEWKLMATTEWILTKNGIIKKIAALLSQVETRILQDPGFLRSKFPPAALEASPKISRGENYLGLPWLILDYPRLFSREDICAVRTMFWWGNYFSTTIHLAGRHKEIHADALVSNFMEMQKNEILFYIPDDPWRHHLGHENYRPVSEMTKDEFTSAITDRDFIKIARKLELTEWEKADELLAKQFQLIAGWL